MSQAREEDQRRWSVAAGAEHAMRQAAQEQLVQLQRTASECEAVRQRISSELAVAQDELALERSAHAATSAAHQALQEAMAAATAAAAEVAAMAAPEVAAAPAALPWAEQVELEEAGLPNTLAAGLAADMEGFAMAELGHVAAQRDRLQATLDTAMGRLAWALDELNYAAPEEAAVALVCGGANLGRRQMGDWHLLVSAAPGPCWCQ